MNPELSRALGKLKTTPFWQFMDRNGSLTNQIIENVGEDEGITSGLAELIKQGEDSLKEPWRYIEPNQTGWENADFYSMENFKLLGELLGGTQLVEVGKDEDGTRLIVKYNSRTGTHYIDHMPISFDAFMAQNQSPIEWSENAPTN